MPHEPNPDYLVHKYVALGEAHRTGGEACQDHAANVSHARGVAVIVADGCSTAVLDGHKRPTRSEIGAFLVAEIAAAACTRGFVAGDAIDAFPERVADDLHMALFPMWRTMGDRAALAFPTTLLVGIATATEAIIFGCGDGAWGALLPATTAPSAVVGPDLHVVQLSHALVAWSARGGAEMSAKELASLAARGTAEVVRQTMRIFLRTSSPVDALHVATDGLADEADAAMLLRSRVVRGTLPLRQALKRPTAAMPEGYDCDDFAAAWAATAHTNRIGRSRPEQARESRAEVRP